VYVDFHAGDIPIRITTKVGHSSQYSLNRKWNIQITQIDCGSHERGWYSEKEWKCVTTVMWDYWFFITPKVSVFMLDHHTLLASMPILI